MHSVCAVVVELHVTVKYIQISSVAHNVGMANLSRQQQYNVRRSLRVCSVPDAALKQKNIRQIMAFSTHTIWLNRSK
jgi:hypothetical protein